MRYGAGWRPFSQGCASLSAPPRTPGSYFARRVWPCLWPARGSTGCGGSRPRRWPDALSCVLLRRVYNLSNLVPHCAHRGSTYDHVETLREEEATLPLAQAMGSASLSRALVGSLYININIPTYSRRPWLTEKVVSPLRFPFSLGRLNSRAGRVGVPRL